MSARIPIPAVLAEAAFLVRDGLSFGLGRERLDGPDLARPFHGVRSAVELGRVAAYLPLLRDGDRFSSTTAARLLGVPLPRRHEDDVHVTAGDGMRMPRGAGVIGHESDGRAVLSVDGLPISDPVQCFMELARVLGVDDLVAAADFLIHDPRIAVPGRPFAELGELAAAAAQPRRRGAIRARAAVALARAGVESPAETRLRLLLVRAGIPEPRCGFRLDGVGWFDLAWPGRRVLGEYDGDQHRTSARQYDRDIRRFDAATELGWRVVRVRASGLGIERAATVERVRRALAAATLPASPR